jgi:hypothetical protein
MFYSDITSYFIILATAVTLNVAGVNDIETAAQAASALPPLLGDLAFVLFTLRFASRLTAAILHFSRSKWCSKPPKHWARSLRNRPPRLSDLELAKKIAA